MKNREPNPILNLNKYHLSTIDVWNGFGVSTDDVNPEINIGVDSLDKWAENKFEEAFNYKKDNLENMKSFLCLCKLVKDWRLYHSLGLNYYGLHEKGLTSFILSKERLFDSPYISKDLKDKFKDTSDYKLNKIISNSNMIDKFALTVNLQCKLFNNDKIKNHSNIENLLKKLPLYVDLKSFERDDGTPISGYSAWGQDLYDNTFFSYTYNTFATSKDTIYLTEKTWKDIMCFHPFLLVSNSGSLKELKKLGYKTFSSHINESYDDEEDFNKRSEILLLEVNRLCEMNKTQLLDWYANQADILIHNFKHFVKSNPVKETINKIMELYKSL